MLTNTCNRSCEFCFADKKMEESKIQYMPLEQFQKIGFFLKKSNLKTVPLIGGEPTLHPEFQRVVEWLLENQLKVRLYTNLIFSEKKVSFLKSLSDEDITIIVNAVRSDFEKIPQIQKNLGQLGQKITLSYVIDQPVFDANFAIESILKYNLKKDVRVKLALPIYGGKNQYLSVKDYPKVGTQIVEFAEACHKNGITISFACGFMKCMFQPQELERLTQLSTEYRFFCHPMVDIDDQLKTWYCFPLGEFLKVNLDDFSSYQELTQYFLKRLAPFRRSGAKLECETCEFFADGSCHGGCTAHTLQSFKK